MNDAIIPAILNSSLEGIVQQLETIAGAAPVVQLDVIDGAYAPSYSWPYTKKGNGLTDFISGEQGLPFWEVFDFEIDLMVTHCKRDALEWINAGATRIVIHLDSPDAMDALDVLQSYREGTYPVALGIALPSLASTDLLPSQDLFDYIQIMGISRIGFQGEPLDDHVFETIKTIRTIYSAFPIQVDGGVKEEHIQALKAAGATRFVMGSGIFTHANPSLYIEQLQRRLR